MLTVTINRPAPLTKQLLTSKVSNTDITSTATKHVIVTNDPGTIQYLLTSYPHPITINSLSKILPYSKQLLTELNSLAVPGDNIEVNPLRTELIVTANHEPLIDNIIARVY